MTRIYEATDEMALEHDDRDRKGAEAFIKSSRRENSTWRDEVVLLQVDATLL